MSQKLKFVWIDDDPDIRRPESLNLGKRLKLDVDYKDVRNNPIQKCIEDLLNLGISPDLILIDHKLDYDKSKIFKTGSGVAALIRDKWPSCPIICVTGVEIETLSSLNKSLYEEVIQFQNISEFDEVILSIARSFKLIAATKH